MRDGNIHYLYYLMNINLNWSKSDHHTVMLKYCACNNITVPCRPWCFCNIDWNQIFQRVLFLQHKHPADIWAAVKGSLCVFEWVLLYFLRGFSGISSSLLQRYRKCCTEKKKTIWCETGKVKQIYCLSWYIQWCLYQITVHHWDVCVFIEVFSVGQIYRVQINWADY